MNQYQKDWEAVNEVIGRYADYSNLDRLDEMAARIASLEATVEELNIRLHYIEEGRAGVWY